MNNFTDEKTVQVRDPVVPPEIMRFYERVTGKQLYAIVLRIVRDADPKFKLSKLAFCKSVHMPRSSLHRLKQGQKPSLETVVKVLQGGLYFNVDMKIKL